MLTDTHNNQIAHLQYTNVQTQSQANYYASKHVNYYTSKHANFYWYKLFKTKQREKKRK